MRTPYRTPGSRVPGVKGATLGDWIAAMLSVFVFSTFIQVLGLACVATPKSPTVDPRAYARGTVEALESAWLATAEGCMAMSVAKQDDNIRAQCADVLLPARDALLAAAAGVDSWNDVSQHDFPCLVTDVGNAIAAAKPLAGNLAQVVDDSLALARSFVGQCQRADGGTQ